MPVAKIIKPGLLTTVQDLGRTGFRHLGVPVSGAMDQWALRTANTLVGNPQGAAVLETTLSGPVIQFLRDCIIAITGADMSPRISGQEVPLGETIYCSAGSLLELGYRKNGCRCYLAFAGGIEEPPVLESRSTFLTGGFGGLEGRRMRNGDLIKTAPCDINKVKMGRSLGNLFCCNNSEITVKVILGINRDKFNSVEYNKLFSTTFVVSRTINRMGCHLDSNTCINSTNSAVSESYPAVPGSIQILPSGLPVILLNDAQSTGGYPQIAAIIAADLWKIGQAVPGDRICFTETDYSTAAGLYQQQCDQTKAIEYKSNRSFGHKTPHYYYKVTIQYKS
jgi:biotin-dependent carboxylase-like uncharacterized protein